MSFCRGVYIFEESPKSIQDNIGDVYCPVKFCFNIQQREMCISWQLCNNSEIHLWLWKVWSLNICSQSPIYVTIARKDDTNRQNTLFLCWKMMNLVPNRQLLLNVPFQPNKYTRKDLWVDNKVQKTIGDVCIFLHKEMKSVFTFQPIKRPVSTTVKSEKADSMFWIILLRTKNRQLCCFVVMVHIVLQKRRVVTTKKKSHLHFWRNFSANHNQADPNLNQKM